MFNIFVEDVIKCIGGGSAYAPMLEGKLIPRLLFVDDLAVGSFAVNGLQKGIDQVAKYGGEGTE